jgi:serine protease Do
VTIGDREKVFAEVATTEPEMAPEPSADAGEAKLGLVVRDLSPAISAKVKTSGVVVSSVKTGSFADLQGLEPGLVITHVNRKPTASKSEFNAVTSKLKPGDDVVFEVIDPQHPEAGINYIGGTL